MLRKSDNVAARTNDQSLPDNTYSLDAYGMPLDERIPRSLQSDVDLHLAVFEASELIHDWQDYIQFSEFSSEIDEWGACEVFFPCIDYLRYWANTPEIYRHAPTSIAHINNFSSALQRLDESIAATQLTSGLQTFWIRLLKISTRLARHYNIVPPLAALDLSVDIAVCERIRNSAASIENAESSQSLRNYSASILDRIYSLIR